MVRIGLGLYGLDASGTMKNLQPIGRFHTRISHLHTVLQERLSVMAHKIQPDHAGESPPCPWAMQTVFRALPEWGTCTFSQEASCAPRWGLCAWMGA